MWRTEHLCPLTNPYIEALTTTPHHHMIISGDGALMTVIKVKWGPKGGPDQIDLVF